MKSGVEWRNLLHKVIHKPLTCDHRKPRNIINRFFRVKLGTLPANFVQNINKMSPYIKKTKLKNSKEPHRASTDNNNRSNNRTHNSLRTRKQIVSGVIKTGKIFHQDGIEGRRIMSSSKAATTLFILEEA